MLLQLVWLTLSYSAKVGCGFYLVLLPGNGSSPQPLTCHQSCRHSHKVRGQAETWLNRTVPVAKLSSFTVISSSGRVSKIFVKNLRSSCWIQIYLHFLLPPDSLQEELQALCWAFPAGSRRKFQRYSFPLCSGKSKVTVTETDVKKSLNNQLQSRMSAGKMRLED